MKKRFSEEQIVKILQEHKEGKTISEVCRKRAAHRLSDNRILRNECLNLYYFSDLSGARKIIENWRRDYNVCRPQKGLKGLTPNQYKDKLLGRKPNLNSGRI